MKLIVLLSMFLASTVYAGGLADWIGNCGNENSFCRVKVVRVYDGDTFYVNIDKVHSLFGDELGIRIAGIDTAEIRGGTAESKALALKAKDFTNDLLNKAKRVDLEKCVRGKFFRIVCTVLLDGKSLGDELLKANLAKVYDK